jgi:hypothetical protein
MLIFLFLLFNIQTYTALLSSATRRSTLAFLSLLLCRLQCLSFSLALLRVLLGEELLDFHTHPELLAE